jgi:hypothetical protein
MSPLSDAISRRSFLAQTVGGVTACGALARPAWAAPQGANDAIRVGVVGVRGKGGHHIEMLRAIPGVRIVALCDVDETVLNSRAGELSAAGIQVRSTWTFARCSTARTWTRYPSPRPTTGTH